MKKIAIMQPYLFPYLGYWQLINSVDEFIIFDDVNFIKKGWIHRNNILLNKAPFLFSLPVNKPSQNKLINETCFLDDRAAKENLLKTITTAYKKAPYYDKVFPIIENIILNNETNVPKYIKYSFDRILEYLSIEKEIKFSSSIFINTELKAQDRILAMCDAEEADFYINAIGGRELYSKELFNEHGIILKFIQMNEILYNQFNNEFVPNLSIIDVMMFNSPENIREMLNDYELI